MDLWVRGFGLSVSSSTDSVPKMRENITGSMWQSKDARSPHGGQEAEEKKKRSSNNVTLFKGIPTDLLPARLLKVTHL